MVELPLREREEKLPFVAVNLATAGAHEFVKQVVAVACAVHAAVSGPAFADRALVNLPALPFSHAE